MIDQAELRRRVFIELTNAGFELRGGLLVPPSGDPKDIARSLHATQRRQLLTDSLAFIERWEDRLLEDFADGVDIKPEAISPVIRPVETEEDAALFRFASLHWSVPVSPGYGRRTRFLVTDNSNNKLIGIFALGDPVFNLRVRDDLIGWGQQQRQDRLYNVFDAYVLGAVEPYRQLIGGKLIALCSVTNDVIDYLGNKYAGTTTVIKKEQKSSRPVLVTTTSALGRSSIYNRLRLGERTVFHPVGYTEGFGHFQFSNELFQDLVALLDNEGSLRGNKYGLGPNWKMRTIRTALVMLGLSGDLLKHGIRRQVFLAPLAVGWRAFLRGDTDTVNPLSFPLDVVADHFRTRWAIPRAERRPEYRGWSRESMRLSPMLAGAQPRLW